MCGDPEQLEHVGKLMAWKQSLPEDQTQYVPPTAKDGQAEGAVLVSDGVVVVQEPQQVPEVQTSELNSVCHNEGSGEVKSQPIQVTDEASEVIQSGDKVMKLKDRDEEERIEIVGSVLDEGMLQPSVLAEVEVGSLGGSANQEGSQDSSHSMPVEVEAMDCGVSVEGINVGSPRTEMKENTKTDPTLATIRRLADEDAEGYQWNDGLVFRHRLDCWGDPYKQLSLPVQYRSRCLELTHEKFGHRSRNKVTEAMKKLFHWPNMYSQIASHCKSCEVCQKYTKTNPKVCLMQEREVVTVPSERVCIDLVGPFPKGKGGFEFLLTYVDVATRWPEAVPLGKTTSTIVIRQLYEIFARNGFPTTLVSDNGSQFCSKQFEAFLKKNGIEHVRTSPYHPQENGVVERLHGSLNGIIAKTIEKKGSWPDLVPMALYFIRSSPCVFSGFLPFMLKHGWEPVTPLQLLYKGWVQESLGEIDLEDQVIQNTERVHALREKVVLNYTECSKIRKQKWDKKAKPRAFEVGQLVLIRKPGLCQKLSHSWVGPYPIVRINSPLSYQVDTENGRKQVVHVQCLKRYVERETPTVIKRVTTVLDPDTPEDSMDSSYAELNVTGQVDVQTRESDVQKWLKEFGDIMTKEPGLTPLAEFEIDTGQFNPIAQRPYNTPLALRESVDNEVDWLLEKNYIRRSESPLASPMVTVRKPDGSARLCVDFKLINKVTTSLPFYMPRVEEVLEAVGRSRVISKIDGPVQRLLPGAYEIKRHSKDSLHMPQRQI